MFSRSLPARLMLAGASALTIATLAACSSGTADADTDADASPEASASFDQELADLLPESIADSGVMTVGAPYTLKPSIFTDDAGEPVGISVDLSEAIGEILGVEVEWHEAADPVTALQSGAIDVSMGFLSDSPAREEVLTMVPQFQNTSTLLIPGGSDVTDLEHLCGETLAVVSGSQQENLANRISEESCADSPIEVSSFAGAKDAITQVQSGRAAAFAAPRMILAEVAATSNGTFEVTEANYADYPFAMGVTTDNADFAEALASALQQLFESGQYDDILAEWDVADIALTAEQIGVNTGSTDAFEVNQ